MNGKLKKIERVLDGLGDVVMWAALGAGLFFVVSHFLLGWNISPIYGGGMSPTLGRGDLAVVISVGSKDIAVDDIIVYHSPLSGNITAHRVIKVHMRDGQPLFRTQGDANDSPDPYLVPSENVIGRAGLTIPLLGYLANFVGTPLGFTVLVGLPGLALAVVQTREMFSGVQEEKIRRRARWTTGLKTKHWLG